MFPEISIGTAHISNTSGTIITSLIEKVSFGFNILYGLSSHAGSQSCAGEIDGRGLAHQRISLISEGITAFHESLISTSIVPRYELTSTLLEAIDGGAL